MNSAGLSGSVEGLFQRCRFYKTYENHTPCYLEVKMVVGGTLTAGDKDHLAQLFLESVYTYEKEGKRTPTAPCCAGRVLLFILLLLLLPFYWHSTPHSSAHSTDILLHE